MPSLPPAQHWHLSRLPSSSSGEGLLLHLPAPPRPHCFSQLKAAPAPHLPSAESRVPCYPPPLTFHPQHQVLPIFFLNISSPSRPSSPVVTRGLVQSDPPPQSLQLHVAARGMLLKWPYSIITLLLKTHGRLHPCDSQDITGQCPSTQAQPPVPSTTCQHLQSSHPISHLKLQPHASPLYTHSRLFSPLLQLQLFPWPRMPSPPSSFFKTQLKWPFLQEASPELGNCPLCSQMPTASAPVTAVTNCLITPPLSESFTRLMDGR